MTLLPGSGALSTVANVETSRRPAGRAAPACHGCRRDRRDDLIEPGPGQGAAVEGSGHWVRTQELHLDQRHVGPSGDRYVTSRAGASSGWPGPQPWSLEHVLPAAVLGPPSCAGGWDHSMTRCPGRPADSPTSALEDPCPCAKTSCPSSTPATVRSRHSTAGVSVPRSTQLSSSWTTRQVMTTRCLNVRNDRIVSAPVPMMSAIMIAHAGM